MAFPTNRGKLAGGMKLRKITGKYNCDSAGVTVSQLLSHSISWRATLALSCLAYPPLPLFVAFQFLPTVGASDCEFFTHDGDSWLSVANTSDAATGEAKSKLYRWNGKRFVEFASIQTEGVKDWTSFTIGGNRYLAATGAESTIYRYQEPVAAGADGGGGPPMPPVRRVIWP